MKWKLLSFEKKKKANIVASYIGSWIFYLGCCYWITPSWQIWLWISDYIGSN